MTLKELARELRKIFRFRYLTVERGFRDSDKPCVSIWLDRPTFRWDAWEIGHLPYLGCFDLEVLNADLDLSEYEDADGDVDFSKCIVEVE